MNDFNADDIINAGRTKKEIVEVFALVNPQTRKVIDLTPEQQKAIFCILNKAAYICCGIDPYIHDNGRVGAAYWWGIGGEKDHLVGGSALFGESLKKQLAKRGIM